jgi:serine/threonine protein kinase
VNTTVGSRFVFVRALELDAVERKRFLRTECSGDDALLGEVESMLNESEHVDDDFLSPPEQNLAGELLRAMDRKTDSDDGSDYGLGLQPGDNVASYRLVESLGKGGFGDVYLEEQQEPIQCRVALKVIKLGMDTRRVVARFKVEQQALAMMDHPNIARVYDAGATEQGRPFFVMEHVDGVPITDYCNDGRLGIRERLNLFQEVCHAVQHAHFKGIIHRDIKPSNILVALVDGKPTPKVIDFGIAKAMDRSLTDQPISTRGEQSLGAPGYMSPEQLARVPIDIDTRTDVFSLGVLLYELLVGALPFNITKLKEQGFEAVREATRELEPSRPSSRLNTIENLDGIVEARRTDSGALRRQIRGDLDWIVMRAMAKDRALRYPTASALAADVQRHLRHEPVIAGPPGAIYRMSKFVRKHRAQVGGAALLLIALIFGVPTGTWLYLRGSGRHGCRSTRTRVSELWRRNASRPRGCSGLPTRPGLRRLTRRVNATTRRASRPGLASARLRLPRFLSKRPNFMGSGFTRVVIFFSRVAVTDH